MDSPLRDPKSKILRRAKDFRTLQEFWGDLMAKHFQERTIADDNLLPLLQNFFLSGAIARTMLAEKKNIDCLDELQRMTLQNAFVKEPIQ